MNFLLILISILFTAFIGYVFIRGFNLIEDKLFALACSYGLGIGLIYYQLFLYSRLGISWSKELIIIPWILLCVLILFKNFEKFKTRFFKIPKFDKIEILFFISILFLIFYTVFEATIRPATTWDSWATWLMEAKAYFHDGRLIPSTLEYLGSDYPLVLKLNWVFNYITLGKVDDTAILLTSSAVYISSLIAFFASSRKKLGRKSALLFTFLLASIQVLIRQGGRMEAGQADLPLGYFAFISSILLIDYFNNKRAKTLLLFNIFLAILSLTKAEGLPFAIISGFISIYIIFKSKLYNHFLILLFWVIPIVDWRFFRIQNHIPSYYFETHHIETSLLKTKNALHGSFLGLINIKSWAGLWILYIYSLIFLGFKKNMEILILNILVISQIVIYLGIYLFTSGNGPESSWDRLLVHIAPIAMYVISLQYSSFKKS